MAKSFDFSITIDDDLCLTIKDDKGNLKSGHYDTIGADLQRLLLTNLVK